MFRWWTYSLSDFLLFSAETYYRLFELYNQEIWPLQLLPLAAVAVALMVKTGPARQGRWTAFVLAASWLWVAWAYHLKRYATINWVAHGFAAAFAIEAIIIFLLGVIGNRMRFQTQPSASKRAGLGLLGFAIVGQPLIPLLTGRPWMQAELFGAAPDATAIGTLGLLLLAANRRSWPLSIIPLLWCAVGAATLWALSSPGAFVLPAAALIFVGAFAKK
jgi:hypothetical protein